MTGVYLFLVRDWKNPTENALVGVCYSRKNKGIQTSKTKAKSQVKNSGNHFVDQSYNTNVHSPDHRLCPERHANKVINRH